MLGYELVQDIVVGADTSQVDFIGLNFTSDEELLLVCDVECGGDAFLRIGVNGDVVSSNYYCQYMNIEGNSVTATRTPQSIIGNLSAFRNAMYESVISLSESGHLTSISSGTTKADQGSLMDMKKFVTTKNAAVASITSLHIFTSGDIIKVGSRFKLYKLVAEKIADITVSVATNKVDITGLTLTNDNQLMLVSDWGNVAGSGAVYLLLYVNDNLSYSSYYRQKLDVSGTNIVAARTNNNVFTEVTGDNLISLALTNISLSNNGNFITQTKGSKAIGSSSLSSLDVMFSGTFTESQINKLTINTYTNGNDIKPGSRFKLYKLI